MHVYTHMHMATCVRCFNYEQSKIYWCNVPGLAVMIRSFAAAVMPKVHKLMSVLILARHPVFFYTHIAIISQLISRFSTSLSASRLVEPVSICSLLNCPWTLPLHSLHIQQIVAAEPWGPFLPQLLSPARSRVLVSPVDFNLCWADGPTFCNISMIIFQFVVGHVPISND